MIKTYQKKLTELIHHDSAGGIILMICALLALFITNSDFSYLYDSFLSVPMTIQVGDLIIKKPLLLWINDGLMAIFFFYVGLEIKKELLVGQLSNFRVALLPALAALGGMVVPAIIFLSFNIGESTLDGWGIPVATDIAFALGVLSLVGSRIPSGLRILLLSLAIIDDLFAILIIAAFYTEKISLFALALATLFFLLAILLNIKNVRHTGPYIFIGVLLWICVLKSGVHATIAGVLLAFTIPLKNNENERDTTQSGSPLCDLYNHLHPWVMFMIMPLFAFANTGVSFAHFSWQSFQEPLSQGIIVGLFLGKQLGVFLFIGLSIVTGLCTLPNGIRWIHIYGMAILCGIGFTMSLFIGTLAFESQDHLNTVRLSVLVGSALSAVLGYAVLKWAIRIKK